MSQSFRINKNQRSSREHQFRFNAHVGNNTSLYTKLQPLAFTPLLAKDIGINRAILLHQLQYWMNSMNSGVSIEKRHINPKTHKQVITYRKWIRDSISEWQHILVYMSRRTIRRSLESLLNKRLIMRSSKINRNKYNHTNWYSINYEALNHLFVQEHPKLAKSMHIFPEVKPLSKSSKSSEKIIKNAPKNHSFYTKVWAKSGANPMSIHEAKMASSDESNLASSMRPNWTHSKAKLASSISNSSTKSSTNNSAKNSRSCIKSLAAKPNFDKRSKNHMAQKSGSSTSSEPQQNKIKTKKHSTNRTRSPKKPARPRVNNTKKLLGMTYGQPVKNLDHKYLSQMMNAYRNIWMDDMAPEHSDRIYKNMKRWLKLYGAYVCVNTIRRVTNLIQKEIYYGDPAHSSKWQRKLPTTARRLQYLGRSLKHAAKLDKAQQSEINQSHDSLYGNMSIGAKMHVLNQKQEHMEKMSNASTEKQLRQMQKSTKNYKHQQQKRNYMAQKKFYEKMNENK